MTSPFVPGPPVRIAGAPRGPLTGLTFAAKDLFDVAGHPTGGGNPDWARQNPVPTRHAWAVQRLLDAGPTPGGLAPPGWGARARAPAPAEWFGGAGKTSARVSGVLLGEPIPASLPTRLVVAVDAFGFADAETAAALGPMVRKLSALVKEGREGLLAQIGRASCRGRG